MILDFFSDPVLRAPTIGCMLMSMAASLVGVIVFLQKRSLLGESLSHAAYPGVTLAVVLTALYFATPEEWLPMTILVGAFISALIGLKSIDSLQKFFKVRNDSALCFILSAFFGLGITIASRIQFTNPQEYKQIQVYLYGQAATMTDIYIWVYGVLALMIVVTIVLLYKELQSLIFDVSFSKSIGLPVRFVRLITSSLIVLAIIVGIRSVGVVLMSAMLVAPAVAARQFAHKLSHMLFLAAIFGVVSGFFGNYFSVTFTSYLAVAFPQQYISLPTGPMIVLTASFLCLFALLFAPQRGVLVRLMRICFFRYRCLQENLLKAIWRFGQHAEVSLKCVSSAYNGPQLYLRFILWRLCRQGWLEKVSEKYHLTHDGYLRAARIVRLHRLWEVYLADYLGIGVERVHRNAEEMEHILTPELEEALTILLDNPTQDPHHQPIPPRNLL